MTDSRFSRSLRPWASAIVLLASVAAHGTTVAQTTYTLSGQITSFRTWLDASLPSLAGGVPLVDSGQFAGTNNGRSYNWSQTVSLPGGTTSLDFTYDPAQIGYFVPLPNNFSFTAASAVTVLPGVPFTLGSISFTNGQWFYLAELGVHFSATPIGGGPANEFVDTIRLVTNSPLGPATPFEEADYFYLMGHPELGSVRVFDAFSQPPGNPGSTGTVNFIGQIGSLDPVAFVASNRSAFVDRSITPALTSPVPEPSTWAMLVLGLAGVGMSATRRVARQSPVAHPRLAFGSA